MKILFFGFIVIFLSNNALSERTFSIDHDNDTFLMDGKPFQYVAGSFHYFRSVPETWQRKLRLMRRAGLNAVDVYIHWAIHNPKDNFYNFNGFADIEKFLKLAAEEDLYVILRPGPYICAETENGGLPYWLETKYPGIQMRRSDPNYMREVEKWWSMLMPKFEKHWYGNGGQIIMVQLENEYGALGICDKVYLNFLRDETEKYVKGRALPFTVDFPWDNALECGQIDGVFVTVDFGINDANTIKSHFNRLRQVQKTGPLVNSEFYAGWFTLWHQQFAKNSAYDVAASLRLMLDHKANINFYMFFGGTNFGFWAGANNVGIGGYMPDITSYDYDAPLDEAGETTIKYSKIRGVLSEYNFYGTSKPAFESIPKVKLSPIKMSPIDCILTENGRKFLGSRYIQSKKTLTFEELDQFSGFVLYETKLPKFTRDPSDLVVEDLRDRAHVLVDGKLIGILSRENNINSLPLSADAGEILQILVENQGRINFEVLDDHKGILGEVKLQQFEEPYYQVLNDWTITGFPFENSDTLNLMIQQTDRSHNFTIGKRLSEGPVVFHGEISLQESQLGDTYWNTENWGKGFLIVNGFNLGRYWPLAGPQITLFIPKDLLKVGKNEFTIVELQRSPNDLNLHFVDEPIFLL